MQGQSDFHWYNPPAHHEFRGRDLFVRTGDQTDFWRETFYGFWRDNGHFYYQQASGDFSAEVTVDGWYEALYDQAGLMLRLGESHWIKAGIEFTDGIAYFSVVVTNDTSDWSLRQIPLSVGGQRLRLTRHGEAVRVQYFDASDQAWHMVRLAYLPKTAHCDVGMMCCSPQRAGFEVTFKDFALGPPIARELHG